MLLLTLAGLRPHRARDAGRAARARVPKGGGYGRGALPWFCCFYKNHDIPEHVKV